MNPRGDVTHKRLAGWSQLAGKATLIAAALAAVVDLSPLRAQGPGDLLITPKRVVISGRMRTAEVTLVHRGTGTATYRISFQNMRMTDGGALEEIQEPGPGDQFADKLIRYSPRQVVLESGAVQTVRLLVRKPRDLALGEYRSHLLFRAVPPPTAGPDIEALALKEGEIRVRLIAIYGVSIPVIVRHGELSATVTLSDVSLKPAETPVEPPLVAFRLNRSGDRSVYGDVTVSFKPYVGSEKQVGLIRGVAIYTPNESRTVQVRLRVPEGVVLEGGRLRLVYRARPEEGGAVVAEADIPVP